MVAVTGADAVQALGMVLQPVSCTRKMVAFPGVTVVRMLVAVAAGAGSVVHVLPPLTDF